MIIANPVFTSSRTLLCAAVFALITGLSFTSETTAQVPPPVAAPAAPAAAVPATPATPAPETAPAAASPAAIVYNATVDRLDHLYPGGVVATVGDRNITVAQVRREIGPLIPMLQHNARTQEEFNGQLMQLQNSAIKLLVERAMLVQQFHDRREGEPPRQIAQAQIDERIAEEQKQRFDDDRQKFLEHLRQRGQTMADYRKDVEEAIILGYMRAQEKKIAKVAPQRDAPLNDPSERPLRLRIIQLSRAGETDASLLEKANAILARLKQGETFAQLATEFDQSGRRARGGDWGWLGPADFRGAFRDTAMALQKGEVSAPLLIPEGCFLLYAEDRR